MGKPSRRNANELYDTAVTEGSTLANELWGSIPKDFAEIVNFCDDTDVERDVEKLVDVLREFHIEKDIYSEKVEHNLQKLKNGSVLGGQQPIVLGGPSFIANKIACLAFTSDLLEDEGVNYAPVFMIGSYDGLQKELVRSYFPNPISSHATLLDLETDQFQNTVANMIELPEYKWFKEIIAGIEESFRGFRKKVKGAQQKLINERFDHIVTLLTLVYHRSESFTDMFIRLWGTIVNVVNDYGIIFLPTSDSKLKEFYLKPYMKFLENIRTYTEAFDESTDKLEKLGYDTSLPKRSVRYSPFYVICDCHIRVNPDIKLVNGKRIAHGHCKECKSSFDLPINTMNDLEKLAERLAPRVDTSQMILQDILNVKVRISGPGEIAYYAQVAPAIRAIGFRTPIFVKYKRLFYNSPWNEKLGKLLGSRNQGSLHSKEMFDQLKRRLHAIREMNKEGIRETDFEIDRIIREEFNKLVKKASKNDPGIYLSWQFGRFTPEKYGQEVSWIWIDMALQTGLTDYIQTYTRMYNKYSVPGRAYFTNTNL